MKKFFSFVLIGTLFLFISFSPLKAQSCNSGTKVVSDIWDKTYSVAILVGCIPANALAATVSYAGCVATTNFINTVTTKLIQFWNANANNSWATIGPRQLKLNKNLTGNLVGTGGRLFVSFPVFNKNSIKVTIDETGGRGKTSVVVCKVNQNKQHTKVATKWFNDTNQRKNKTNEHREVIVNGVKNHIITVHLDGKSVGNTFKYKVRAN